MNSNKTLLLTFCALGLGLSAKSMAGTITVDGTLGDWGLFAGSTTWTPSGNQNQAGNYSHKGLTVYYTVEDYISGNGYLNPGWGGQAYDAEALYVTWDADSLYIALVTGHDPNTKNNPSGYTYSAGDFALNFWSGATPDSNYEFGIRTPNQSNNIGQFSTNVYRTTNDDWLKDPLWNTGAVTSLDASKLNQNNPAGQANMMIQKVPDAIDIGNGSGNHAHWIYEVSVAKTVFGDLLKPGSELDISWTMNCANDVITVRDDIPTIDEPPVWALLGLTLPAVFWRRRRSAKR